MLNLMIFDLRRKVRPRARRLRVECLRELASIPYELRPDVGLSDAAQVEFADTHVNKVLSARRAAEADTLLAVLSTIARRRGCPGLRWSVGGRT